MSNEENTARGAIPHTCRDRAVKRQNDAGTVEIHHYAAQDPKKCVRCSAMLASVVERRGARRSIRYVARILLEQDPAERPFYDAIVAAFAVKRDPGLLEPRAPKEKAAEGSAAASEAPAESAPKRAHGPYIDGRSPLRDPETGDEFVYDGVTYGVTSYVPGRGRNGSTLGYTMTDSIGVRVTATTNLSRWRELFRKSRAPKPGANTAEAPAAPSVPEVAGTPETAEVRPRFAPRSEDEAPGSSGTSEAPEPVAASAETQASPPD